MKIHNKFNKQEYIIYAIIIVLMFIIPTVSTLFHGHDIDDTQFLWNDMLKNWESIGLFVIVLALHDVLLAPLLVYRHKTWQYLVGVILLGAAFYSFKYFTRPADNLGPSAISKTFSTRPPLPPGNKLSALDTPPIAPPLIHRHDIISLILLMFGFGTNNGVKFYSRSLVARKEIEELEKENLNQKMEHLRYQIHPHFFMNTLNNIHALVDIDPEKAKESIIDLPNIFHSLKAMRHTAQFSRGAISQPQAITGLLIDKLYCSIPRTKILFRIGLQLDEGFHFLFFKQVITAINRLVANSYLGHITEWPVAATDKHI